MKNIIIILFFLPLFSFGQSKQFKKDFKKQIKSPSFLFLTDWGESQLDDIIYKKHLSKIISKSQKFGYKLLRRENQIIFNDGMFYYVILKKEIFNFNYELFPNYTLGFVYKKYYFKNEKIDEAIILKIQTEIKLYETKEVNNTSIINYSEFIRNFVKKSYLEEFKLEQSSKDFNIESMFNDYYDVVDVYKIKRLKEPFNSPTNDKILSIGSSKKQNRLGDGSITKYHMIFFSIESPLLSIAKKQTIQQTESYNDLRFTIGGKDIRKSNIYDLKSMINIFLEDCKKNNITTPNLSSVKAVFQPLEGNTIAVSQGFNIDSSINLIVDPSKWARASKVKRWYILYHELGHDVLNLDHGEGGKMMFNFADREYTWDEFFEDKKYMFKSNK